MSKHAFELLAVEMCVVVELGIRRRLHGCCKRQDELSQKNGLIDSLRNELDTAREEKNQTQQRYNDQMNEIDAIRHERDDVKKSCEEIYVLLVYVSDDRNF